MSISVEAEDLGKVVQLLAKNDGWDKRNTLYGIRKFTYVGGDPEARFNETPLELVEPLREAWLATEAQRPNDYNGPKVAVNRLAVVGEGLVVGGYATDYFTLWGLPKAEASRELFEKHEREIIRNKVTPKRTLRALYEAELPWGLCTHNTLLDRNGDVLMMVRSQSQGFNAGRVSATQEEQTEPTDTSAFFTSARSFKEELGLEIPEERVKLLGVAMEKGAAYAALAYITETDVLAKDIVATWRTAKDHNENTALFSVPMTQVNKWAATEEVGSNVWGQYLLAGGISPDAKLKLHATSAWRIGLTQEYTKVAK